MENSQEIEEHKEKNKDNRVNVRLNGNQMESLDKICEENGIKSKSKILKYALDLVTKGTSEIDFGITTDYTKEERKTIQFEDDKKINGNCPHCTGKTRLEPEHYKKFQKEIIVIPSHIPRYQCKNDNCDEIHENPKYQNMPKGICNNCYQFSKDVSNQCVWCNKQGTIDPLDEKILEKLNITKPN